MIQTNLTQTVDSWAILGHHALLERFTLRHGKAFAPAKRIGRRGAPNRCFANAGQYVLRNAGNASYVEGFAMDKKIGFPFLHAWVTTDGTNAVDHTLDADDYEYFGSIFSSDVLRLELLRTGRFGLLDTGLGLNTELIFKIDPTLQSVCEAVRANAKKMEDNKCLTK